MANINFIKNTNKKFWTRAFTPYFPLPKAQNEKI